MSACTANTSTGAEVAAEPAPGYGADLEWLNASQPLVMDELRDKIVLTYFWTSSCLNCRQILPELDQLQAEYPEELIVVGVHSPKFERESDAEALGQFLARHEVDHPIVNDVQFQIWNDWGVTAWPTSVLVDPAGDVVARHTGVDVFEAMEPMVAELVKIHEDDLDRSIRVFPAAVTPLPPTVLSFPAAVLADSAGQRLFVADTNNHRIVIADLTTGEVEGVIGTGSPGREDGSRAAASFNQPAGMALSADGSILYVADSDNHLIRAIDLDSGSVSTLAGTGDRGTLPAQPGPALETDLNVPLDVTVAGDLLYISMAGFNQIWTLDPVDGTIAPLAGIGRQGVGNGPALEAELAGPAGLSSQGARVYFADSESSSVRWTEPSDPEDAVGFLAGGAIDLFDFGDIDGSAADARFQHPLGVAADGAIVWVSDTYNSKVKQIDLMSQEVTTLAGSSPGWRDGLDPLFSNPAGIDIVDGKLYVADTDNHSVRVVDTTTGEASTVILKGIERLVPDRVDEEFAGTLISADPVVVGAGPGTIHLDVTFPTGYKANDLAPSNFAWTSDGGVAALSPTAGGEIVGPSFPLQIDATFAPGSGTIRADVWLVYCEVESQSICLFDRARIEVPIEVESAGSSQVNMAYQVQLPEAP